MSQVLRQSTQVVVRIGPAVAVGDGFTPVTTLDLSTADEAELLKAAGAATSSIAAATFAAITGADGWYDLTLTTTHTDTVGTLDVVINDDSLCLPIHARFQVIEEAAYDAMYASSADPKADINVGSIDANAITATSIASDAITAAKIANGAIDAATFAADVDAEILSYIVDDATRIDASALNTAAATTIPAILTDTAEIGAAGAGLTEAGGTGDQFTAVVWNANWDAEVQSEVTDALNAYDPPTKAETDAAALAVLTTQMTEAYAAAGVVPTLAQILFEARALLAEKAIASTTLTTKKIDGATTAATYTLDDDTNPSSITRAT